MRSRLRRGTTLTELIVALVILAILAGVAASLGFRSTTNAVTDQGAAVNLTAVQMAARQYAATPQRAVDGHVVVGEYPTDLISKITVPNTELIAGTIEPVDSDQVSVTVVDASTLVLAKRGSGNTCVVLVESLTATVRWGRDTTASAGQCTGDAANAVLGTILSDDAQTPSDINLG
jgi:prepilin-type N-terminal cleavage/methylation domain-containing protein